MYKCFNIVIFLFLVSTFCWSAGSKDKNTNPQSRQQEYLPKQIQQEVSTALASVSPYYIGNGGKGISLAILTPQASGLADNQKYLPVLVQGEFVNNFSSYSAISVLDRERLDNQYAELLSGYYDDNAFEGMDLGHLTPTTHIMGGIITRTVTGYVLQMQITKTVDKTTIASYSETLTFTELDNLTGIRRASLELLEKMDVIPTELTKIELTKPATSNHINAQTVLAQGINAQRGGTVVEALTYYYQASSFDSSLVEATGRASSLSTYIISGNIGENVRNDIQQRNAWLVVLREAAMFYKERQPFEIIYDPNLVQGKINYTTETVDISFKMGLFDSIGYRVLTELKQGLENTKKSKDWGLDGWPFSGEARVFTGNENFNITIVLNNEDGITIGRTNGNLKPFFGEKASLSNFPHHPLTITFSNVNANDITDKLSIQITSINNRDIKTNKEQNYIGISTEDLSVLTTPYDIEWKDRTIVIKKYKGSSRNVIIPQKICRWPVSTIGQRAFAYVHGTLNLELNLSSVIIPQGIISIEESAFYENTFKDIFLPDSVITIGKDAFYKFWRGKNNNEFSITIPNSVRTIGGGAFLGHFITKITIPSNVELQKPYTGRNVFEAEFDTYYNYNGKRAGTYIYKTTNDNYRKDLYFNGYIGSSDKGSWHRQ
jgi:hypothetical protein